MTTSATTPKKSLDSAQRAWLKKIGAALGAPLKAADPNDVPLTGVSPEMIWEQRLPALKEAESQVKEMEEAQLSKAPLFRKGLDLARGLASQKKYDEAVKSFDELAPKIKFEYEKFQHSRSNGVRGVDAGVRKLIVTVTDSKSNDAIKGATVQVKDQKENTGNTGSASLALPSGKYSYSVAAEGYAEAKGNAEVTNHAETALHVELTAKGAPVIVTVTDDATTKPIEGAAVQIASAEGATDWSDKGKTDATGVVKFTVGPGTRPIRVIAQGYEENRLLIVVKDDSKVDCHAFMHAGGGAKPSGPNKPGEPTDPNAAKYESQILKVGAKGPAVEHLQKLLKASGASIEVDGKFGPATQTAVRDFQKNKGLTPVDGIVGPKTWPALASAGASAPPQPKPANPVLEKRTTQKK